MKAVASLFHYTAVDYVDYGISSLAILVFLKQSSRPHLHQILRSLKRVKKLTLYFFQFAFLSARIQEAEEMSHQRRNDLQKVVSQFSEITKLLQVKQI